LIATQGYACPNPECLYFGITDQVQHALVGDGCHGKAERIQTFRCQACHKTFTARTHTPLYRLKTPTKAVGQVLTALAYGLDPSAASVIFGHHPLTISRWLNRAGQHSQRLHHHFLHRLRLPYLQLDELRTRLRKRNRVIWLWTAIDPITKLMPAVYLGERDQAAAHTFIHSLVQTLAPQCLPLFTSDGLNLYFYALTAHFGQWTWEEVKGGKLKQIWQVAPQLLYGQLIKQYRRRKLTATKQKMRLGAREEMTTQLHQLGYSGCLNTSFIERLNLALRHGLAALSRKTWATAQKVETLQSGVAWWRAYYHFVKPHLSLRAALAEPVARGGQRQSKRYRRNTPAMAAGLTDHRWTVVELLSHPSLPKATCA
jgi:IS1 family transposase/transposase-like protein